MADLYADARVLSRCIANLIHLTPALRTTQIATGTARIRDEHCRRDKHIPKS